MPLEPGTRLGPYEISALIGEGGMGQVYRARDTSLNREVALKVLPDALAGDADRLARFQREAETLAGLDHPNIATVHGLETSGGVRALVMELVDGEDLTKRIARGPVPLDEALPIARQIADALEAAHEHGIVHRDLKPDNVMVKDDGTVRVLDFGLAKAMEPTVGRPGVEAASTADQSSVRATYGGDTPADARTMTSPAITEMGMILGTAAYMAPEQAKGRSVDKRADIWAFGAVLFEMLSGRRAFKGGDVSEMIAALLRDAPEFGALPADVPTGLRRLLGRCLEKDPKQRIRDIGDVRFELDAAVSGGDDVGPDVERGAAPSGSGRERIAWALAAVALGAAGVLATMLFGGTATAPAGVIQAQLPFTRASGQYGVRQPSLAISPDGRHIAFIGVADGVSQLYVRSLENDQAVPIRGTEGGGRPFFAADERFLAFWSDGQIKKVALSGGAPETLGPADDPRGAVWGDDGFIVFTPSVNDGLWRLPQSGGTPERLTSLDVAALERTHRFPEALPGGRGILFTIGTTDMSSYDDAKIAVLPAGSDTASVLIDRGTMPRYASSGHIVYHRGGELLAVEFDLDRLEVTGTPVSLVGDVGFKDVYGSADFAVSASTLVYLPGGETQPKNRLLSATRAGETTDLSQQAEYFFQGRLSADGQRLLTVIEAANDTLWLVDLRRDNLSRLTFRGNINSFAWSADGTQAIYSAGNEIRSVATDGSGVDTLLYSGDWPISDLDVSTDGSRVVFDVLTVASTDLWMLSLADNTASPWLATSFNEMLPRFSPDGDTVAYTSTETGRADVFLRSDSGEKVRVSDDGGDTPMWSSGNRELVYMEGDRLVAVSVLAGDRLDVGAARTLFALPPRAALGDIARDGQRFVLVQEGVPLEPPGITLIHGWVEHLRTLAAGR